MRSARGLPPCGVPIVDSDATRAASPAMLRCKAYRASSQPMLCPMMWIGASGSGNRNDRIAAASARARTSIEPVKGTRGKQAPGKAARTPRVLGLRGDSFEGARVFVLPNPSGRNANYSYAEMLEAYTSLRRYIESRVIKN